MRHEQVKAYVDQQVQDLSDRKIKPLIQSINGELEKQRGFEAQKAALDAEITKSNERIAEFQKFVGQAQTEVNQLATKLAEATTAAVTTGRE